MILHLGHIILTDFGLSARLANRETKLHSFSGTAIYLGNFFFLFLFLFFYFFWKLIFVFSS